MNITKLKMLLGCIIIKKWRNLKSIGCVKKTIENINTNKTTVEIRYYISNLSNNILEFSNAIRNEWAIENKLHWHLDFTFKEDYNSTFEKNTQKNLNIIRKFCLSILKLVKELYSLSLKNIRKSLCMDFENEINKIFTYLDTTKIRELVNYTNSQCLWFYPDYLNLKNMKNTVKTVTNNIKIIKINCFYIHFMLTYTQERRDYYGKY